MRCRRLRAVSVHLPCRCCCAIASSFPPDLPSRTSPCLRLTYRRARLHAGLYASVRSFLGDFVSLPVCLSYIVGDKTIAFSLMDEEMYSDMSCLTNLVSMPN